MAGRENPRATGAVPNLPTNGAGLGGRERSRGINAGGF